MSKIRRSKDIVLGNKVYWLSCLSLTVFLNTYNLDTEVLSNYFIQFTNKNIWYVPKKQVLGKFIVYGWLFFYFGRDVTIKENNS